MTCKSCSQNQMSNSQLDIRQMSNSQLDIRQMSNMSIEQILDLYEQGYRIPISDIKSFDIKSLAIQDIRVMQYIWLGLFSYVSYKSYKSQHNIWAIIFGGLALGSAGGIIVNYEK